MRLRTSVSLLFGIFLVVTGLGLYSSLSTPGGKPEPEASTKTETAPSEQQAMSSQTDATGTVHQAGLGDDPAVEEVSFSTVDELDKYLQSRNVARLSRHGTQYVVVESFPNDFGEIYSVERKKRLFRNVMLPIIRLENERLQSRRRRVQDLIDAYEADRLSADQKQELRSLRNQYEVVNEENHGTEVTTAHLNILKRRIDIIPVSLALAQAANESAWGTSRFSLEANNIFGEWIYNQDRGLKPREVDESAPHRIRIFEDLRASVRSYMHNLNSHHAYDQFRQLRAQHGDSNDPLQLVQGLKGYSSKGEEYIDMISGLIENNDYRRFDRDR